jgi:surfeit locus 1 family protein
MTGWRKWAFVLLMLTLTVFFVALGVWQWQRLQEKEALIATVTERLADEPVVFPEHRSWTTAEAGDYDYRPVIVHGRYLAEQTVFVFTNLADPKGQFGGPGYWVMTPLALEAGGTIWINRGFIPESARADFAGGGAVESGFATLSGIAKPSESAGAFTPKPSVASRTEWVRNVPRLTELSPDVPAPVAPVYLDLPATASGALPQGGETVVNFPNNHFGYALTWFGFAILTPIMLFFWLRRERQPRAP